MLSGQLCELACMNYCIILLACYNRKHDSFLHLTDIVCDECGIINIDTCRTTTYHRPAMTSVLAQS